jgi:hypothetical protein
LTTQDYDKIKAYGIKLGARRKRMPMESEKETQRNENCEDAAHCQRVVGEAELASLLSEGWHATLVLPSGKVIVSR